MRASKCHITTAPIHKMLHIYSLPQQSCKNKQVQPLGSGASITLKVRSNIHIHAVCGQPIQTTWAVSLPKQRDSEEAMLLNWRWEKHIKAVVDAETWGTGDRQGWRAEVAAFHSHSSSGLPTRCIAKKGEAWPWWKSKSNALRLQKKTGLQQVRACLFREKIKLHTTSHSHDTSHKPFQTPPTAALF